MGKNKKKIFANNASWTFDKNVAQKFDYHINKSIPIYKEFQWLALQLSDYYIKEDSIVYDIGCSTGKFLLMSTIFYLLMPKPVYKSLFDMSLPTCC